MNKKIVVGALVSSAIAGYVNAAEPANRTELVVKHSTVKLERAEGDFIGGSEADRWSSPSFSLAWVRDLDDAAVAIKGELAGYNTQGVEVGRVEDDSPLSHRTLQVALLKEVSPQSTVYAGLNYIGVTTTQVESDSKKDAFGFGLGYARESDSWAYAINAGAVVDGTEESQDALIRAQYFGVGAEYAINNKFRVGAGHSYLTGDEFDLDERKSDQRLASSSIYGEATLGLHRITAGIRHQDWKREDVEGSGLGDIERADGTGFFISYHLPIGSGLKRTERLLLERGPNITEFVMVGGSIMD